MTVTVHVSSPLRAYCGGAAEIRVEAGSVAQLLEEIERDHPGLYRSVCDDAGKVRSHVNIFVNDAHVRDRGGIAAELAPGDVVTLLPAVSGG